MIAIQGNNNDFVAFSNSEVKSIRVYGIEGYDGCTATVLHYCLEVLGKDGRVLASRNCPTYNDAIAIYNEIVKSMGETTIRL